MKLFDQSGNKLSKILTFSFSIGSLSCKKVGLANTAWKVKEKGSTKMWEDSMMMETIYCT